MSKKVKTIKSSDQAWEERRLGADEAYVDVSESEVDEIICKAVNSRAISIRMRVQLIDDLKFIADEHNIGYQTLMKQILQRFVDSEMKKNWNKMVSESMKKKAETEDNDSDAHSRKHRAA